MKVRIKKLTATAKTPTCGSTYAAGYDLYADTNEKLVIQPHTTVMIGTGLAAAIPEGYYGAIYARSGIAAKKGCRPANCVGIIDADYRGEIKVALHNDTDIPQTIEAGERIAQFLIAQAIPIEFEERGSLDETERGAGGFGSTGKN